MLCDKKRTILSSIKIIRNIFLFESSSCYPTNLSFLEKEPNSRKNVPLTFILKKRYLNTKDNNFTNLYWPIRIIKKRISFFPNPPLQFEESAITCLELVLEFPREEPIKERVQTIDEPWILEEKILRVHREERSGWVSDGGQEIAWIDHKANFLLSLLNRAKGKEKLRANLFFFFLIERAELFLGRFRPTTRGVRTSIGFSPILICILRMEL